LGEVLATHHRKNLPRYEPLHKASDVILSFGIFGPKRDEVTGYWRRLNNEELHDLYSSPNIVRVIK
jgi:hypothetical protein